MTDASDADSLLEMVHARLGGGVDIQTFGNGVVEVRWRRLYGDEWSEERYASEPTLRCALAAVLRREDMVDAKEATEEELAE